MCQDGFGTWEKKLFTGKSQSFWNWLNNYKLSWSFKEFEIGTPSINSTNIWRLKVESKSNANINESLFNYVKQIDWEKHDRPLLPNENLKEDFEQVNSYFQQVYRSRFRLCSLISPYKTPEQVCRFFGNHGEVFAKLKSDSMRVYAQWAPSRNPPEVRLPCLRNLKPGGANGTRKA